MSIVKTKNGFPLVKTYLELTDDEGKRVVVDNTAVFGFLELEEGTCLLNKDLECSFDVKETIEEIGKQIEDLMAAQQAEQEAYYKAQMEQQLALSKPVEG